MLNPPSAAFSGLVAFVPDEIQSAQVILMSDVVSEADVPLNSRGVVDQIVCSVARRCWLISCSSCPLTILLRKWSRCVHKEADRQHGLPA